MVPTEGRVAKPERRWDDAVLPIHSAMHTRTTTQFGQTLKQNILHNDQ